MRTREVIGYPQPDKEGNSPSSDSNVGYGALEDVLTEKYATDAHFVSYSRPDVPLRLNTRAWEKIGPVPMVLLTFDVDCPKDERVDGHAPDAWWEKELRKIDASSAEEPEIIGFRTRGGYRLVSYLEIPFLIDSLEAEKSWTKFYLLTGAWLHKKYGISIDPRCANWGRLQRCPLAVRDGVREPGVFVDGVFAAGDWKLRYEKDVAMAELLRLVRTNPAWRGLDHHFRDSLPETGEIGDYAISQEQYLAALLPVVSQVLDGNGRHYMYMNLCGSLLDMGFPPTNLVPFAKELSEKAGVDTAEDTQDRVQAARSTLKKFNAGLPYSRIGSLAISHPKIASALDSLKVEERLILKRGSDLEIGEAAIRKLQEKHKDLVFTENSFWACTNGVWKPFDQSAVATTIHTFDGMPVGEKGMWRANQGRIKGSLQCVKDILFRDAFFDSEAEGVAFTNGFLRLDGDKTVFETLRPEHCIRYVLPYQYDATAQCPMWAAHLKKCLATDLDNAVILQQFLGACLFGLAPRYQKCLVLSGAPESGKSTTIEIAEKMFASGCICVPPQHFGDREAVRAFRGARLNSVSEMPKADVADTETFKALISGDTVSARELYVGTFSLRSRAGHLYACNELMGTSDFTEGWFRRFMLITFDRVFKSNDKVVNYAGRLAVELPGIINWAVEGVRSLVRMNGYLVTESTNTAKDEWKFESDSVRQFVEDRVERTEGLELAAPELYSAYCTWSDLNGHRRMASIKFSKRMKLLGFVCQRNAEGAKWNCRMKKLLRVA